jgi:hypothetical protein
MMDDGVRELQPEERRRTKSHNHPLMKKAHRKIYNVYHDDQGMPRSFKKAGLRSSPPGSSVVKSRQSETLPLTSKKMAKGRKEEKNLSKLLS